MKKIFQFMGISTFLLAGKLVFAAPLTFEADLKKENVLSDMTSERLT